MHVKHGDRPPRPQRLAQGWRQPSRRDVRRPEVDRIAGGAPHPVTSAVQPVAPAAGRQQDLGRDRTGERHPFRHVHPVLVPRTDAWLVRSDQHVDVTSGGGMSRHAGFEDIRAAAVGPRRNDHEDERP
jgi:hypothetical protein